MKKTTCNHLSAATYRYSVYRSGIKLYESDTARTRLLKYHVSHTFIAVSYFSLVRFYSGERARYQQKSELIILNIKIIAFNELPYESIITKNARFARNEARFL